MGGDCLSYPIIYDENATDFFNLGLGTLPDATKVEVTEERNGEFTLSMTYLVDGLRANEIKKNRIIKVDAGHVLKGQRFVIKKINRQLVDKQLQLQVYAEHVSYITNDLQLKPNVSVNGSGDAAIKAWRSNIIDVNPLVVDSDIETSTSTTWTIDKVQSARQALGGVSGSLLDLWGGEYRFDNYHISLKKQRGTVANTLLSYGRNITDFDQEENITDTYTTVYPYATYAETTTTDDNASSESKLMTLPELTVDSEYVGNYPNRKILPVDLTSKFVDNEKPTIDKLREYAKAYVKSNSIGIPTVSIKLSYVDLSQSSNYEALKLLEVLDLCDTVPVRFSKLGVDTKTKVSRVVWDVLAEHYTSMELGDTRYTIGDMINNALNTANEANQNSQEAQNSANHAVVSADGHTMIFYGPNTPVAKNVGDLWYQPDGEYETMYRWDGVTWAFVMSTRDTADAQKAADTAQKEAEEAKTQANESVAAANDAVAKAGFANDTATQAKSDAASATQNATTALTNAGTAFTNAKNALDNVAKLDQTVKTEVTNINGQLTQKVSQTTFDTLKGTVTSQQTEINQNASGIKLKADKSYADTINNSVVKNTSSVGLLNDQIALTVSKTELTSKLNGYATQTWSQGKLDLTADGLTSQISSVQTNLDNMQVGGRNLVLNSDFENPIANVANINSAIGSASTEYSYQGSRSLKVSLNPTISSNDSGVVIRFSNPQSNSNYTATGWLYSNVARTLVISGYSSTWASLGRLPVVLQANTWTEFEYHFTTEVSVANAGVAFFVNGTTGNDIQPFYIDLVKIEQGNKATDWSPAPEDMATVTQFTSIEQTLKGVQITANNAVTQSQYTQLAGQITTTIGQISGVNLIPNSDFSQGNQYWNLSDKASIVKNGWKYTSSCVVLDPSDTIKDTFIDINVSPNTDYTFSCNMYGTAHIFLVAMKGQTSELTPVDDDYQDNFHVLTGTDERTPRQSFALKRTSGQTRRLRLILRAEAGTTRSVFTKLQLEEGTVAHAWAPSTNGLATFSQITQLQSDVNFRVQKGDVINQINISPESILIAGQKVHITGLTRIDNAVIKDAMIADIKADKITAGTLNAANVDVINLNANNITTGTLKGANLSLNLNTGEVLFQKGSIKSANGNLNLDISKGTMAVINEYKSGFYFEDGKLVLNDGWLEGTSSQPKYGSLEYNANYFTVNGLAVKGTEGVTIGTPGYNPLAMFTPVKESGIAIDKKHIEIGSVGPTIISSGNEFFMNLWTQSPFIAVGTTVDGNHMPTRDPGSRISIYAEYVHIKSAYSNTASGSANLMVAEDGALVRSTSASKYKTDIIRTNVTDYGDKLLNLPTATWTDIAETKRYRDDPTTQPEPTRNFGMIAEDLAEAGLEMLVVRGTDGELEGINYDRIGPALIPVIAKLKNEVETLKQQLEVKTA